MHIQNTNTPPIHKTLYINNLKSLTVKLFFLFENFSDINFAIVKPTKSNDMKKYLLLFGAIISICIQAFAERKAIYMDIYKSGHDDKRTTVRRSPMQPPFHVFYDDNTHQVEVSGDKEFVAQILLYDENGNTLDYSPYINATLNVPSDYSGLIIISIENENWSATGEIAV